MPARRAGWEAGGGGRSAAIRGYGAAGDPAPARGQSAAEPREVIKGRGVGGVNRGSRTDAERFAWALLGQIRREACELLDAARPFLVLRWSHAGGRFDIMFAAVVAIAVLGFGTDRLLLWARAKLLPGRQLMEEAAQRG